MNATYIALGAAFVAIGAAQLGQARKADVPAKARAGRIGGALMMVAAAGFFLAGALGAAGGA